jgi:hypothetical protein
MKKLLLLILLFATACGHPVKHMGPVAYVFKKGTNCYWFLRPDKSFVEACFDNPPPLTTGTGFADLWYTDDNKDLRHFIGAKLN